MPFKGITFAGQNVTPKNDGGLYASHHGDGILWGCEMAISGDDLVIQSGEFIMCGRYVQVDGATNVDLSGRTLQTGYIQVIMNADLSQSEGNQWYTTFVESATTTFPALTQDDINDTGTLYQYQLAIVQISGGNLTAITQERGYSPLLLKERAGATSGALYFRDENGDQFARLYGSTTNLRLTRTDNNLSDDIGVNFNQNGTVILYSNGNGNGILLYPNGRTSTNGAFTLDNNGDILVRCNANDTTNRIEFGLNDGTVQGGFAVGNTSATIYSEGGLFRIRPNGSSDSTGQIQFDSGGQQIGGHPFVVNKSLTTAKSISASATTNLISQTSGLDASGIYQFTAYVGFRPTSASSYAHISLGTSATSQNILRTDHYMNSVANYYWTLSGFFTGRTSVYFNIWAESGGNTIADVGGLQIVRIN